MSIIYLLTYAYPEPLAFPELISFLIFFLYFVSHLIRNKAKHPRCFLSTVKPLGWATEIVAYFISHTFPNSILKDNMSIYNNLKYNS